MPFVLNPLAQGRWGRWDASGRQEVGGEDLGRSFLAWDFLCLVVPRMVA